MALLLGGCVKFKLPLDDPRPDVNAVLPLEVLREIVRVDAFEAQSANPTALPRVVGVEHPNSGQIAHPVRPPPP